MSADEDPVGPGSGEFGEDLGAWGVFGDSSALGQGVVPQFDVESRVLGELVGEGLAGGSDVVGERVSGGKFGEEFEGLSEVFGIGGVERGEDFEEIHGVELGTRAHLR